MPIYKNKISLERNAVGSALLELAINGADPQDFSDNALPCEVCGGAVGVFISQSKNWGQIKCAPRICVKCKNISYEKHKAQELVEEYEAQNQRCAQLQNQKVYHVDHFPTLANTRKDFTWQSDFLEYIHNVLDKRITQSMLVQGNTGSGKTYLSKVLVNESINRLIPVCFVKAVDLAIFIKKLTYKDDYRQVMKDFRNVQTLVLDDFGSHHVTDVTKEILFSILDFRYENRKRTIITTNLSNDALIKLEPRSASRMLDEKWMDIITLKTVDIRRNNSSDLPF